MKQSPLMTPRLITAMARQRTAEENVNDAVCAIGEQLACDLSKRWPKREVTFHAGMGSEDFAVTTRRPDRRGRYAHYFGLDGIAEYGQIRAHIPEVAAFVDFATEVAEQTRLNGWSNEPATFKNGERIK